MKTAPKNVCQAHCIPSFLSLSKMQFHCVRPKMKKNVPFWQPKMSGLWNIKNLVQSNNIQVTLDIGPQKLMVEQKISPSRFIVYSVIVEKE